MATNTIRTRDEVEALKKNWLSDPCYDLDTVEGFEFYSNELREFQGGQEAEWRAAFETKINADAAAWGMSREGVLMVRGLLTRIEILERELEMVREY